MEYSKNSWRCKENASTNRSYSFFEKDWDEKWALGEPIYTLAIVSCILCILSFTFYTPSLIGKGLGVPVNLYKRLETMTSVGFQNRRWCSCRTSMSEVAIFPCECCAPISCLLIWKLWAMCNVWIVFDIGLVCVWFWWGSVALVQGLLLSGWLMAILVVWCRPATELRTGQGSHFFLPFEKWIPEIPFWNTLPKKLYWNVFS